MTFGGFEVGHQYSRKNDIHKRFGGQPQGGISTPRRHPAIFLVTGETGTQHGYADGWTSEGTFNYFGEGQSGDMRWKGGNVAIRDHAANGKDLLLFQTLGKGRPLRFVGEFSCVGWHTTEAPDSKKSPRQAFVFELILQSSTSGDDHLSNLAPESTSLTLAQRRALALAAVVPPSTGTQKERTRAYYKRSATIRSYVLDRAGGHCEHCAEAAPFKTNNNFPYLEPHHIRRLGDGGPDDPRFMAALCPNCHRRVHYGSDGKEINLGLTATIQKKEAGLG